MPLSLAVTAFLSFSEVQKFQEIHSLKSDAHPNSLRTAKKTPHFTFTNINRLTLFKEIIAVCSENDTKLTESEKAVTIC
jgi:hypothetical protein